MDAVAEKQNPGNPLAGAPMILHYPERKRRGERKMKKAVVTANYGGKDPMRECYEERSWDYFCFTDQPDAVKAPYVARDIDRLATPMLTAKYVKIMTHRVLPEYDCVIWIDGSSTFRSSKLDSIFSLYCTEAKPLALHIHPERNRVDEEMKEVLRLDREHVDIVDAARILIYGDMGYRDQLTLTENAVLYKRNHDRRVIELMERWWDWCVTFTTFDQFALQPLIAACGIQTCTLPTPPSLTPWITRRGHKRSSHGEWRNWTDDDSPNLQLARYVIGGRKSGEHDATIARLTGGEKDGRSSR
jgi:hypothetical protein